jgi:hypothetical protein
MKLLAVMFSLLICTLFAMASSGGDAAAEPPYRIVNGRVDRATFTGWRIYHQSCHVCHGVDAVGTAIAPSLTERLRELSPEEFAIKVATSYRIVRDLEEATGDDPAARREALILRLKAHEDPVLLMPAWEGYPTVKPHLSDLYAYLKARSDGALGPGKPRCCQGR